jgi:spermidine synthase
VFATLGRAPRTRNIGVVGLGAGALSAYAEPGQSWTYFEIDPAVVRIASNSKWFCYLDQSAVKSRMVLGDARLSLEADSARYDLLVLDAYTSDAIPVHLLTREAFRLYLDRLSAHGVLAVHLSNRYFDLEPVVGRIVREAGLAHRINSESGLSQQERARGQVASYWAVIAHEEQDLAPLIDDARWKPLRDAEGQPSWTDSYSSLVSVLR